MIRFGKHLLALALILFSSGAFAQSVVQSGSVTPGHLPRWISSGVIGDGGGATNGSVTNLGIFANGGLPDCLTASTTPRASFDPNSSPYTQLCRYANQGGRSGLTLNSYNGAAAANFSININGTEYPFPASGTGTGNVTGPGSSTVGDLACWNNTDGTLLSDCGSNLSHVNTNADLKALAGSTNAVVIRNGFYAAGDTPPVLYRWSASSCSLATGAGDNGTQVAATGGGCWLATFSGPVDVRQFGATCDALTDDTPAFNNASLPSLPLFIPPGKTCAVVDWQTTVPGIFGVSGQSTLTLGSTGTTSDPVMWYKGAGPFVVDGVSFTCPIYDPITGAAPNGQNGLLIQSSSTFTSNVRILHVNTTGCQRGITAARVQNFYMSDVYNDRPQSFGWVVSDQVDTLTANTSSITIRDTRGSGAGQYCGSIPVNLPIGGTILAPRNIDIRGVSCQNSGLVASKNCFDLTGSAGDQIYFEGMGTNCLQGGMEAKRTDPDVTGALPDSYSDIQIKFTYYASIDIGNGVDLPFQATSVNPNSRSRFRVESYTTFVPPPPWNASTYYAPGAAVTNGGNTYLLVTPGMSASSGGPSGTTTGITDGTAQWNYFQATPATAASIGCVKIEAITNLSVECTAFNTAFGYLIGPRGSSDTTIRQADLYFSGTVARSCLALSNVSTGTIDKMRLMNWACRSTGSDSPLYFSLADTFTNLQIVGGDFSNTGSAFGALRNSASNMGIKIVGAPRFTAPIAAIYMDGGTTNIQWSGGGLMEVTSSSGDSAITATGASTAGSITVETPVSVNTARAANSSHYPAFEILSGSTATIRGRFMRGFATVSPVSTACNYGDTFLNSAPGSAGATNGWMCTGPSSSSGTFTAF